MGKERQRAIELHGGQPVDPHAPAEIILQRAKELEQHMGAGNPRLRRAAQSRKQQTNSAAPRSVFDLLGDGNT